MRSGRPSTAGPPRRTPSIGSCRSRGKRKSASGRGDAYVLEKDEELTRKIESLESFIRANKKELRHVGRRGAPNASEWLVFLGALLLGALVVTLLVLHLGELFGWGLTERFDALLEAAKGALLSGDGPLNMVGQVLWLLVEVLTGVVISLPLNILCLLQVIIPEPRVLMGVPEGALIVLVLWLVWALSPLVTHVDRRGQVRADRERLRDSIKRAREDLEAAHAMRDTIRSGTRYPHALERKRRKEEFEAQRRKAYSYIDQANRKG